MLITRTMGCRILLKEIKSKEEADPKTLNSIERKELDFYIAEYGLGVVEGVKNASKEQFMKKDPRGRVRFFSLVQPLTVDSLQLTVNSLNFKVTTKV